MIENHVLAVDDLEKDSEHLYIEAPYRAIVRIGEIWDGNPFLVPTVLSKEEYAVLVKEVDPNISDETLDLMYNEYVENF